MEILIFLGFLGITIYFLIVAVIIITKKPEKDLRIKDKDLQKGQYFWSKNVAEDFLKKKKH